MKLFPMFVQRKRREQEIEGELRFHIDKTIEAKIAAGMDPDRARRETALEFGELEQWKEECRDVQRVLFFDNLASDLKYAARELRRSPGFTALAAVVLALGIGANTAIFSVVDGILFRPLPFPQSDRLITIAGYTMRTQAALVHLQQQSTTVDFAAFSQGAEVNLTGRGEPLRLPASSVSSNFFDVLRAKPALGSVFRNGDDRVGNSPAVLLSHRLWTERFRQDRAVIGQVIRVDDTARTIVGVMPAAFGFPSAQTQMWIPLAIDSSNIGGYWWNSSLTMLGRVRPKVDLAQAQQDLLRIVPRIKADFPYRLWPDWGMDARVEGLRDSLVAGVRTRLLIVLGSVGLVLLIACVNFSNLLLLRNTVRKKELTVRAALGAGRWRILQQLLTENLMLASAGCVLGVSVAWALTAALKSLMPANTPRLAEGGIDWRVLVFATATSLIAGLVFGMIPALRGSRLDLQSSLKSAGRGAVSPFHRRSLLSAFVVAQVAISVIVVIGSGLLARSLWNLTHVDPGFSPERLLTLRVTPNGSICTDKGRCSSFYARVLQKANAVPGVISASAVDTFPLSGEFSGFAAEFEGHPVLPGNPAPSVWSNAVTPGYLQTMRIPLLAGRGFTDTDRSGSPLVALVSESTAKRFWPGENALGKTLRSVIGKPLTVVGVVRHLKVMSLGAEPNWLDGQVYLPWLQGLNGNSSVGMTVVVRTAVPPMHLASQIRRVVAETEPDVPATHLQTAEEVVALSASEPRSTVWLLGGFAVLALLLGSVGIYGVISYGVSQRTAEIGVRAALGARPARIGFLVVGRSLALTFVGLAVGEAGAVALSRFLRSQLFQVASTDWFTYGAVSVLIVVIAVAASYLPARRAMRVDPAVALREE